MAGKLAGVSAPRARTVKDATKRAKPAARPSLAATHPANYAEAAKTLMPPPSLMLKHSQKASNNSETTQHAETAQKTKPVYLTPSPSPPHVTDNLPAELEHHHTSTRAQLARRAAPTIAQPKPHYPQQKAEPGMPWCQHTDPTLTTSDTPPYWSRNNTVLKSDTDLSNGSIVSPTFMHGLPFGSMTEAAHHYPSEECLSRL